MFATSQTSVAALYFAFFNRPADAAGLKYWSEKLDAGASFFDIAKSFGATAETASHYPKLAGDSGTEGFLNALFGQLFSRWPESADKDYWTGELAKGKPAWQVVAEAVLSAKGSDQALLDKALAASLSITAWTDKPGQAYDPAVASWLMHHASNAGTPTVVVDAYYTPPASGRPSTIIDFESLTPPANSSAQIVTYYGLTWASAFGVVDIATINTLYPVNGFAPTSGQKLAFANVSNAPIAITATASFDLESLYLSSGFRDGLVLRIDGYLGATHTGSQLVSPLFTSPTKFDLDDSVFDVVDKITFTVTQAGTLHSGASYTNNVDMVVIDDIEVIGLAAI